MCYSGADNPHLMQKRGLKEQDIELAQHTHQYDGNTELQGDNDEVRRLKIYLMHLLVIIDCILLDADSGAGRQAAGCDGRPHGSVLRHGRRVGPGAGD